MPSIQLLVGMIASGKSLFARMRADAGALVVCHDDLTEMLHARYRYEPGLREWYRRMEESVAWAALCAGRDVVVDRTHLTRESRRRWLRWAESFVSLQTFDGHSPTVPVVAVAFPIEPPAVHALRRHQCDPRGRSQDDWLKVAQHHHAQAIAEPLSDDEGFTQVVRLPAPSEATPHLAWRDEFDACLRESWRRALEAPEEVR